MSRTNGHTTSQVDYPPSESDYSAASQRSDLPGLSIQDAAVTLGISLTTLRRQIKRGQIRSERIPTPSGFVYRVYPELASQPTTQSSQATTHADGLDSQPTSQVATQPDETSALLEALRLVDKLQQQNLELAGRVGYYQAQNEQLRDQVKMLEAPKAEEPSPELISEPKRHSWWSRLFG